MPRHRNRTTLEDWRYAMETRKAELLQEAAILKAQADQIDKDMPELIRAWELAEKHGLTVARTPVDEQKEPPETME